MAHGKAVSLHIPKLGASMKTVMILGGSASEVPVIEAAIGMGNRTIVVDRSEDVPGFHVDDIIIERESIADKEAILGLARKYDIDGIIASVDAGVRSAAYVAQELDLPGISEEAAIMGTDKVAMRRRLKERGIPVPLFFVVKNKDEYLDAISHFSDKAIVKAADSSGSRGIYLLPDLSNNTEIDYAYEYCMPFSGTGELLIEEVMEGPEICTETLSQNGTCYCIQITDQMEKEPPYYTDCGYSQPAQFSEEMLEQIRQIAVDANLAVENCDGSSCTEMIITEEGPKVVEIGVRLAGDYMTTKMVPLSNGVDMPSEVVKIALGEPIDVTPKIDKGSCVRYFMKERVGTIKSYSGLEEAMNVPGIVWIEPLKPIGDEATPLRKSSDRLCLVVAQSDSAQEAIDAAEKALELIDVIVE